MKRRQITANKNRTVKSIKTELKKNGYKELSSFFNLRGKNAKEKVVVWDKRWRGEWVGYVSVGVAIFYK